MNKEELAVLVNSGLSIRGISEKTGKSCGSIRYWLSKYGLKTTPNWGEFQKEHSCSLCGNLTNNGKRYCRSCQTKIRRHRLKAAAVALLGGKCVRCGWDKNLVGLEFHHVCGKKDYTVSLILCKSWESVKKEIEKCELLCSCCHRIEHSDQCSELALAVINYSGRGFN
jgi:hypothetical protein